MVSDLAQAAPATWASWVALAPWTAKQLPAAAMIARGTGTTDYYVVEIDPTTGALPVNIAAGTITLTYDENYGAVGANTLRTAAQIGNATGAASFGAGVVGAQTLRTIIASDQSAIPASQSGTWNITNVSGTVSLPTGAATEASLAKLTQTQGSTTSGQSGPLIQGAVTTSAPTYTTAQTSPLSLTTGGALRVDASGSTQPVSGTVAATQSGTWTVQPGNTANTTAWLIRDKGKTYATSVRNVYSSTNVTTGAWVELIASTANATSCITVFDSSGQTMEIGVGAAASETRQLIIPPGGLSGCVPLLIAQSARVSIRAISATASVGEIDLTGLQ